MPSLEAAPRHGRVKQSHPWEFVVPAFAVLAVFFLTPTIYNFIYAFTDWSSFKTAINPVGWGNFSDLIESGSLRKSLIITLIYAAGVAALQNLFGLMLAILLERDTLVNKIVRVIFFIPVILSALATGYIFQALLRPDGGLNQILEYSRGRR